jgi:hypothetical protein
LQARVLEVDGVDGYTAMWTCSLPLNYVLKTDQMITFKSYGFYHHLKKKKLPSISQLSVTMTNVWDKQKKHLFWLWFHKFQFVADEAPVALGKGRTSWQRKPVQLMVAQKQSKLVAKVTISPSRELPRWLNFLPLDPTS